jgi:beta-lactamase regulating signal transducer with metallopeptidase domain
VILAVIVLRKPARAMFGPETAYRLWAAPALAAAATLLPAREAADWEVATARAAVLGDVAPLVLLLWAAGALGVGALFWKAQQKFLAEARAGRTGPSVVGVITPRILMPPDDGRYTADERALVRAHEREHVTRQDPRASALATAFQCLAWFNPLVHLAAHLMRLDQELACDAAVIRRHPKMRVLYAQTLLKTQLAATPLPFGCYWPPRGPHPLEVRVGLLKNARRYEGFAGPLLISSAALVAAVTAWATQPPVPPHPPYVSPIILQQSTGPTMSVLLLTAPPPAADQT